MPTIEHILPKGAKPQEVAVLLLHYMFPDWSKKKIATVAGYKNPQKPRAVQRIFRMYEITIEKRT